MPGQIERSCLAQGYGLPEGLTWDDVDAMRARWDVQSIFVPIARGSGCIGWGVPHIDGRPLKHP